MLESEFFVDEMSELFSPVSVYKSVFSVAETSELSPTISELSSPTVTFFLSNNIVPGLPKSALTFTFLSNINSRFPETSSNPPSPENYSPLALIFPPKLVISSNQTIT